MKTIRSQGFTPSHTKPRVSGFTLIELLVVIAIIGILSAVVLASLNTARTKGNDAGVKANLDTVKTQAALFQNDNNGSYGTFTLATCPAVGATDASMFGNATVESAIASAVADSAGGTATCAAAGTSYVAYVKRPDTTNSTYWCVDSTGISCGVNTAPTGSACGSCVSTQ